MEVHLDVKVLLVVQSTCIQTNKAMICMSTVVIKLQTAYNKLFCSFKYVPAV